MISTFSTCSWKLNHTNPKSHSHSTKSTSLNTCNKNMHLFLNFLQSFEFSGTNIWLWNILVKHEESNNNSSINIIRLNLATYFATCNCKLLFNTIKLIAIATRKLVTIFTVPTQTLRFIKTSYLYMYQKHISQSTKTLILASTSEYYSCTIFNATNVNFLMNATIALYSSKTIMNVIFKIYLVWTQNMNECFNTCSF